MGIEVAQLILALVGLTTDDAGVVRATRVVMEILGIELIAAIAWTTLLTGLLLAAATQWGLLKHCWIVTKLVITVALMLNGHFFLQHWLREQAVVGKAPESLSLRLVIVMSIALGLLVTATALSIYKPWGKTRRTPAGRRGAYGNAQMGRALGGEVGAVNVAGPEPVARPTRTLPPGKAQRALPPLPEERRTKAAPGDPRGRVRTFVARCGRSFLFSSSSLSP
ncbi:hypothetical protein [Streptomyces sp. NPDC093795]|uniref:hypothetical protein n=1 Tax=Streptomyces sp. NPDC093795 TaxID=3366051 RepID=UPI0038044D52